MMGQVSSSHTKRHVGLCLMTVMLDVTDIVLTTGMEALWFMGEVVFFNQCGGKIVFGSKFIFMFVRLHCVLATREGNLNHF